MARSRRRVLFLPAFLLVSVFAVYGQPPVRTPTPTPTPIPGPTHSASGSNIFKDIASDQKAIWTSPFHLHRSDLKWLVPFGAATAALIATDQETAEWVGKRGNLPGVSRAVSWNGGIYAVGGFSAGMYLVGRWSHNDKLRDTGRLASEALIDSEIVTQVSKFAFGRLRPNEEDAEGRFFHGGRSFFSGHASASWSVASVVACEYRNKPWIVFASYGLASVVSISRFTGRKHFLSDVFVGAGLGYGVGRYVCGKRASHAGEDSQDPNTVSWHPTPAPYFDLRSGNMGGRLSWNF